MLLDPLRTCCSAGRCVRGCTLVQLRPPSVAAVHCMQGACADTVIEDADCSPDLCTPKYDETNGTVGNGTDCGLPTPMHECQVAPTPKGEILGRQYLQPS